MRSALLSILIFIFLSLHVEAKENIREEWSDFNFVPCEGIGIHGSGRIKASAEITRFSDRIVVHTLRVSATHAHANGFSASVSFSDDASNLQKIILVPPWYSTVGPANEMSRVLPRNKTETISGPSEQMEITVDSSGSIEISANVLFSLDGGSCAAGFRTDWTM